MDCSLPCSSVHRISQARVLEWGAIAFSQEGPCIRSNTCKEDDWPEITRKLTSLPWNLRLWWATWGSSPPGFPYPAALCQGHCFLIKPFALSVHASTWTIHYWVLDKSLLSSPEGIKMNFIESRSRSLTSYVHLKVKQYIIYACLKGCSQEISHIIFHSIFTKFLWCIIASPPWECVFVGVLFSFLQTQHRTCFISSHCIIYLCSKWGSEALS